MTSKTNGYGFWVRQQRLDRRVALLTDPGYSWLDGPLPARLPMSWIASRVVVAEKDKGEALVVTVAWPQHPGLSEIRVVAFDEEGNRYIPTRTRGWGGSTEELAMYQFRLDPERLPAAKVRYVGVEGLTAEGLRQASQAALVRARQKQIEVLPLPEVGRPYDFALTNTQRTAIDSHRLRGKAVLIDCWASWCVPCMREMPEVKRVYDKWHQRGLEVVGVSLFDDPKAASAAGKKLEIPWALVVIPANEECKQLWIQATRIDSIPRILLIDRMGILRADVSSARNLEKVVESVMAE
jgi:thiol-disulfide isomerase/thioredoxin